MNARLIEEARHHRAAVARAAMMWTPLTIAALVGEGLLLRSVLGGNLGTIFGLIIVGIMVMAPAFMSIAALRDLRASPVTTEGNVERLWNKTTFLFFGRNYYLLVNGHVFSISLEAYRELFPRMGREVRVRHWPHTDIVISLHLLEPDDGSDGQPSPPEKPRRRGSRRTSVPPPPAP